MMSRPGGPVARELADLATLTIDLLDVVEPDPDGEEDIPLEDGEHGYELPSPLKAWSAWAGRSQRRERL